jgi:hypothetical protein
MKQNARNPAGPIKVNRNRLNPGSLKAFAVPEVYADETCICRGCQKGFIFTAAQKQRLYEEHRAHIATKRVLCGDCKGDLNLINQQLALFDSKLKPKGQAQVVGLIELGKMIEALKRKFRYTQKIDKSKMAQYRKIQKILAGTPASA